MTYTNTQTLTKCYLLETSRLQKEIVPLVHSLCQDVSGEVRGSMCYQLPFIARGLSSDAVKPSLLPLLVELAVDEEQHVRLASVHTISDLVNVLPGGKSQICFFCFFLFSLLA